MNDIGPPPRKPEKPAVQKQPATQTTAQPQALPPFQPQTPLTIKKSRRVKWWLISVLVVVGLAVIVGAVGFFWYRAQLAPVSNQESKVRITVAQGDGTAEVADMLQEKGVVRSSFAMQIFMRLHNLNSIKAGSYLFSANQTTAEIVQWLNEGKIDTFKVTILPGKMLSDIKQGLVKDGFESAAIDAAFAKKYDHPLLKDKPADANLEGYIFPETYFMTADATPEDVLVRSFDEFEKHLQADGLRDKLASLGFNTHQAITLASIVSGEATGYTDRQQIAQVFERRLDIDMVLGSDVTYMYAAKVLGVEPSPILDSPYNTRIHGGLPPGAISNFNLDALKAVANPAAGTYLYFVAGDDGTVHYSYTADQHQVNISRYCQVECFSN